MQAAQSNPKNAPQVSTNYGDDEKNHYTYEFRHSM